MEEETCCQSPKQKKDRIRKEKEKEKGKEKTRRKGKRKRSSGWRNLQMAVLMNTTSSNNEQPSSEEVLQQPDVFLHQKQHHRQNSLPVCTLRWILYTKATVTWKGCVSYHVFLGSLAYVTTWGRRWLRNSINGWTRPWSRETDESWFTCDESWFTQSSLSFRMRGKDK